jgi:hypothetical protein
VSRAAVRAGAAALIIAATCAGCGLSVQSADLFVLTRVGQGQKLTLLISDGGTVRCNAGRKKPLPDPLLLQARDLATNLDNDAKASLEIRSTAATVYRYTIKLQNGTISFPDTAANAHNELAQAELLAVRVAEGPCGLSGQ